MDRELLRKVNAGDLKAREQLWDYLTRRLGIYFLREVRDSETAADLAQNTIIAVLEFTGERLEEDPGRLWALVKSFAERRLARYLTKLGRDYKNVDKLEHELHLRLLVAPSMESDFGEAEKLVLLRSLLEKLPEELQECLDLRSEGYTIAEVADAIGRSPSTAKRRLVTAERRLRRRYERARRTRTEFRSPPQTAS